MTYTLSVVIPNYNNGRFLSACLDSVLMQSYEGLSEILVVDDASTDDSREILAAYAERYPLVQPIFLSENGGVSAARNAGISAAKGEYITFLDADDLYYDQDKLKNEMALIMHYREAGKDIIAYSSIVGMSGDGETFTMPHFSASRYMVGDIYRRLLLDVRAALTMRDYCMRTELVKAVGGYNAEHRVFEDYELLLKLARAYEFYYTGEYGTAYRDSASGLSKMPLKLARRKKNEIAAAQIKTEPFWIRTKLFFERGCVQGLKTVYFFIKEDVLRI